MFIPWLGDKLLPISLGWWVVTSIPARYAKVHWSTGGHLRPHFVSFTGPEASCPAPEGMEIHTPSLPGLFPGLAITPGAPASSQCLLLFQFSLCF